LERELELKGFVVIEGAINPDGDVPGFIQQFNPPFPVGKATQLQAATYLQMTPMARAFVPWMVFIDRKGMIRAQFIGSDPPLDDEAQAGKSLHDLVVKLLDESATPSKPASKRPAR
jgi:hypothetical protein